MATRGSMGDGDMPSMSSSSVANYTYDNTGAGGFAGVSSTAAPTSFGAEEAVNAIRAGRGVFKTLHPSSLAVQPSRPKDTDSQEEQMKERIVRIYVADLDENLTLDKKLVWQSDPIFTDLDDNDLWFDMASLITEKLAEHNKHRLTVRNKSIKDREVMLEAIRPRDLSVNFSVLAEFKPKK